MDNDDNDNRVHPLWWVALYVATVYLTAQLAKILIVLELTRMIRERYPFAGW